MVMCVCRLFVIGLCVMLLFVLVCMVGSGVLNYFVVLVSSVLSVGGCMCRLCISVISGLVSDDISGRNSCIWFVSVCVCVRMCGCVWL